MSVAETTTGSDSKPGFFEIAAPCAALFVLAIAQPLLDLLGGSPEFFLARDSPRSDIVGIALILGVLIPLGLGALVAVVARSYPKLGRIVYFIVVALLGAVLSLQVIYRTPVATSSPWLQFALAVSVGGLLAFGVQRFSALGTMIRIAALAVIAAPILFLFFTPTARLVSSPASAVGFSDVAIDNPIPVVVMVFDEFPVASLIDANGELQSDVYPGLGELAKDATWFRNAMTVQRLTQFSVPAILSGINPEQDYIPTATDYPNSLFTLLGGTYEVESLESLTALCPPPACTEENQGVPRPSALQRWKATAKDLSIVAGHVLLPSQLSEGLPPIDENWANFTTATDSELEEQLGSVEGFRSTFRAEVAAGRGEEVERFIAGISPQTDSPPLYFVHVLLPHAPWDYLPNGQRFAAPAPVPGTTGTTWTNNEWLVNQGYQLHLVQTMYADHLVSLLTDRLKEVGLYQEALIVVAADHGISFRPGVENRRAATPETVGDVAAIPLFIKAPGLEAGAIDDYRVETVDILPTIADALGIVLPWEADGVSLLDQRPERGSTTITGGGTVTFGVDGKEKLQIAERKIEAFGVNGPFGLTPPGMRDLLGARIEDYDVVPSTDTTVTVDDVALLANVDTSAERLPLIVSGAVTTSGANSEGKILAISINGEISAVTESFLDKTGHLDYYALLPPESLQEGSNEIMVLEVEGSAPNFTLSSVGP